MIRSSGSLASAPGPGRQARGPGTTGVAAPREELRTVTIVFVDMVGFTARTDDLDPEDVRELQRQYFQLVGEVLRRWGGVVEKYVGDAVMAVYGAPVSTEHDAYRAVRAGLEIQQTFGGVGCRIEGAPVQVRVGIATGPAVVDLAAATDGGQALVSGAVVSTAARVQASAPPGSVVVTTPTREAAGTVLRYAALPPVAVAPGAPAREVWLVHDAIRPVVSQPANDEAPMVGRQAELADVTGRLRHGSRHRIPQWISVVGHAGTGKSRLVREVVRTLGTIDGGPVDWRIMQCLPWDDRPCDPDLGTRLLAAAAHRPTIVVVEDLHWADPSVARFLSDLHVAAVRAAVPLALLVTHLPEPVAPGTAAPASRDTVRIRRLGEAAAGELLQHLLRRAGQAPDVATTLLPLVAGVPRYAEEYVRMIAEGGHRAGGPRTDGADLPVPEPVHRLVAARLDRLCAADRAVLRAAAVLGDGVRADAVAHLLGANVLYAGAVLRRLLGIGVLVRRGPASDAEREYAFAEPAIRQVAYGQLPRAARGALHRRAAQWLLAEADQPAAITARARHEIAAFDLTRRESGASTRAPHPPTDSAPAERLTKGSARARHEPVSLAGRSAG